MFRKLPPSPLNLSATCATRPAHTRAIFPAQIPPFLHFARPNSSRISTSKKISIFCISLIRHHLNSTRINTSGNKDLKSPRISTSGAKDLKSCRINTSKKHGRGVWKSACRVRALLEVRQDIANLPRETTRALPCAPVRAVVAQPLLAVCSSGFAIAAANGTRPRVAAPPRDQPPLSEAGSRPESSSLLYFDGFGECRNTVRSRHGAEMRYLRKRSAVRQRNQPRQ
jgi:hypothetical protein